MFNKLFSMLRIFFLSTALLASIWLSLNNSTAHAANFTVTKLIDSNDGVCDADCSLREAIIAANNASGADTITLPAGSYVLTLVGDDNAAAVGDLDIAAPLTLVGQGAGQTIINAAGIDRVFEVHPEAGAVAFSGLSIINGGHADQNGGGIYCDGATLTLEDAVVSNNSGGLYAFQCSVTLSTTQIISNVTDFNGAAINISAGTLTLTHSLVAHNTSGESGAGIFAGNTALNLSYSTIFSNTAGNSGGGLFMTGSTSTLALVNSLVAENVVQNEGGGVFLTAGQWATIENSTISSNRANTYGGGVNTRIPTTITHSTIVNNIADADRDNNGFGGGIFTSGQVGIQHILTADNIDRSDLAFHDCACFSTGWVTSQGYNLVESIGNCTISAAGDNTAQEPQIGPLQNNGGPTWTHALLSDSPALNAGDPAFAPPPYYDQRGPGFARLVNGRVDIGAYEELAQVFLPLIVR